MFSLCFLFILVRVYPTNGQRSATISGPENHPLLITQKCTSSGGCVNQNTRVVLDSNWRWLHGAYDSSSSSYPACLTNSWDSRLCPDPVTCAQNCYLDSANYASYGIYNDTNSLTLLLYPPNHGTGSRVYLMSDDDHYQLIKLPNQEISFDVDTSGIPCGANGAVYLNNMPADGGISGSSTNQAGARYGTGYCDAQCPQDLKFINGQANSLNWNGNAGRYGTCCHEVDLWESNSVATALTAHTCSTLGQTRCDGTTAQCGANGYCDHSGCDFNPYRLGNTSYYGYGKVVDTSPGKIRVITQFKTVDNTATGALSQIVRTYIRNGKVIFNAASNIPGVSGNSLSDTFCAQEKAAFGESDSFKARGGMASMTKAMNLGMVLTLSVWVDYATHMLWLDSVYPPGANPSTAGVTRGPCATNSGDPDALRSQYPNAQVKFSNIKWGDIGSTFGPPYP